MGWGIGFVGRMFMLVTLLSAFFVIILEGLGAVATGLGNWKK